MRRLALVSLIGIAPWPLVAALATPSPWSAGLPALRAEEALVLGADGIRRASADAARGEGLLVVDLSDEWAPFLFSESDGEGKPVKPNPYRRTFIALADDRVSPEQLFLESDAGRSAVLSTVPAALRSDDPKWLSAAEQRALERARRGVAARRKANFLEVYGIPPTLSVLARWVTEDAGRGCYAGLDLGALRDLDFEVGYQTRDQARRDLHEALADAAWVAERLGAHGVSPTVPAAEAVARLVAAEPQIDRAALERYRRGQARLRAVRAVQDRLVCEGLLAPARLAPGVFDHATHSALAAFEKKNDIFGWGFVAGETREALLRPPPDLQLDALRRILAERVADAAGILEDGSAARGGAPAVYVDAAGETRRVPDLVGDFVRELLRALAIGTSQDMAEFLHAVTASGSVDLRVAFRPPPLPPYYAPVMDLAAEIDRGDVWYDVPIDPAGKPLAQLRRRYPSFTLFAHWRGQQIPLVHWRTTIGSWRSELGADGQVYLKYKNSDVGPRVWKDIVAAPVWVPPDHTPGKDLLVRKVFDRKQGPVTVVNTEVMGPGFASAYGLVMAIHLKKLDDGGLLDNQIRTHGSVDYTSIARRFSHGCHRLVNDRAVRLFDFVLKHRKHVRHGNQALGNFRRQFVDGGRRYEYRLTTRGYSFELRPPLPVTVLEGRIVGAAKAPIRRYVRKPGVDYGPPPPDSPVEPQPVVGP